MADGPYTERELQHLYDRLKNLQSQGRTDDAAKQEIANLKYEIEWAKKHLK